MAKFNQKCLSVILLLAFLHPLFGLKRVGLERENSKWTYIDHQYDHNPIAFKKESMTVCIYYDRHPPTPNYKHGSVYAVMAYNLLGHFREVKREMAPLVDYKKDDLDHCDATIYLGSHYFAPRSEDFLQDVINYEKPFLWANYGLWELKAQMIKNGKTVADFIAKTGFDFKLKTMVHFDTPPTDENKKPGFYRYFWYRGKKFYKYARWGWSDFLQKYTRISAPELLNMEVANPNDIMSYAEHELRKGDKIPYVVHHKNFFTIGDIPFSFIHEVDRYVIFADLLFDFLKLPPRLQKKLALVRLEDIHPLIDPDEVYRTIAIFTDRTNPGPNQKMGLPFTISVVPHYVDPMTYYDGASFYSHKMGENDKAKQLLKAIQFATKNKGRLIYHGYTHQDPENTESSIGCSGGGFEFWNATYNGPLLDDSLESIKEKIAKGNDIFKENKLTYDAWVTPHYQASSTAYKHFGTIFPRTIQRARYVPPGENEFDQINWAGQFFPYVIEKDYYGQWIWPENLGNIQVPFRGVDSPFLHTVEQVLEAIEVHTVLRDTWGSFFWHSCLFEDTIGYNSLPDIVDDLLNKGFEFIDIRQMKAEEECYRNYWDKGEISLASKKCEKIKI